MLRRNNAIGLRATRITSTPPLETRQTGSHGLEAAQLTAGTSDAAQFTPLLTLALGHTTAFRRGRRAVVASQKPPGGTAYGFDNNT